MKKISTSSQSSYFNIFAHSDFGLDTLQARIFTHLLENSSGYDRMLPVRVRTEEILGANLNQLRYLLLEEALGVLSGKRLTKPGRNRRSMGFYPVFEYITCSDEEGGYIEALFSEHIKEELQELTSNFTLKEIASFVMLRHSHTQRMFWFLRPYVNEGKVEITVDELKEVMLGVRKYRQKDAEYERYYDFKTRVLDQAIKTIRDRGLLDIRYREYRVKRVVTRLVLTVSSCRSVGQPKAEPAQLILFA